MRQRSLSILILTALLLAPFLAAAPEALRSPTHEGVVHTSDVTWSGNMTLDEDVTIASGATLTIEAGTNINVTEDITIRIEGDLSIEGVDQNEVTIWGSHFEATSVQARWEGFQIASGASADVEWAHISDARGGLVVESGGNLTIDASTFEDVIMAVWALGTLTHGGDPLQSDIHCRGVHTACLRVDGSATLDSISTSPFGNSSNGMTAVVGNGGNLSTVGNLGIIARNGSDALVLESGSTFRGNVSASYVMRGIRVMGTVDAVVELFLISTSLDTMISSTDGAGLIIESVNTTAPEEWSPSSPVPITQHVISGTVQDITILHGMIPSVDSAFDVQIDGTLTIGDVEIYSTPQMFNLRGDGQLVLQSTILRTYYGVLFDAVGSGTISMTDVITTGSNDLGINSGWDLEVEDSTLQTRNQGLRLLSGEHEFDNVTISRNYDSSDSTSVGLDIVWADVETDDVTITGFNEGVRCGAQCTLEGDSLASGGGGPVSGSGLTVDGGSISLDSLETSSSNVGIDLVDGDVHLSDWTVSNAHGTYGIELANDASATIRNMPGYTSSGAYDGFGDGTLLWGSTGTPNLAVSVEAQFTESNVRVTDVVGTALPGAVTSAHGFDEDADSFGDTSLPLLSVGSFVEALDPSSGMGSSATMSPPGGTLQIAVIPATGDWTIPAGVQAILSGGNFTLNGDLIIESTASLSLIDATLTMPDAANLTIQPNGLLKGDDGVLIGGVASLSAGVPFLGSGGGLSVGSDITFTCYDPWSWVFTDLDGDLSMSQDCELILEGGHASGQISLGTDAILSEQNRLVVTILDAGTVVEGANVSVGGNVVATGVDGQASFISTWRVVDGSGETLAERKTVVAQHANVNRYRSWDPSSGESLEIMISTVTPGVTTGLVRLEPIFSPYHLGGDLTVTSGTTLDVLPDVELTIAPAVGITVEGVMQAEDAWIGGTGSNGISVTSGQLMMSDGFYSGGALDVSGWASLSRMSISDAQVLVSGAVSISDGIIGTTDVCVRVTGLLSMTGTILSDCGMYGLWTTNAAVEITDITLASGNSNGAWIQQGSGNISGWDASAHDGDGPALHLQYVDAGLAVTDMTLSTGPGEAALRIEQSDGIVVSDSVVTGSPGISVANSEAWLLRIDVDSDGTVGAGISVLGVPSAGTVIEDCDVDGFAIALRLEGGPDDAESTGAILIDTELHAAVAINSNTLPFTMRGGVLDGDIEMIAMDKPFTATLIDIDPGAVQITGQATLYISHTWTVDSPVPVQLQINIPEFEAILGDQELSYDGPQELVLRHGAYTESGRTDSLYGAWTATASGFLPASGQLLLDTSDARILSIAMGPNAAPVVTILGGDLLELNAGTNLDMSATATDANGDVIAEWVWTLEAGEESHLVGDSEAITIDDLEQGDWILRATAIDAHGASGDDTVALTVNAADADDDFGTTCPQQGQGAWWDAENGWFCGPDVYDEDDDNDGIRDDRDRFPRDPCAHRDTDDDGLPDSIIPNCETDLIIDEDDDNDGVIDAEDLDPTNPEIGSEPASETAAKSWISTVCSPAVVLSVAVIIVFTIFAYMRSNVDIRRED